ncbi:hypothetical protein E4T56_gene9866 [Termitomyces sp. T112]|nr:hypothetical protein E4T56_gene9866 [Termitomyces sp. T112]
MAVRAVLIGSHLISPYVLPAIYSPLFQLFFILPVQVFEINLAAPTNWSNSPLEVKHCSNLLCLISREAKHLSSEILQDLTGGLFVGSAVNPAYAKYKSWSLYICIYDSAT